MTATTTAATDARSASDRISPIARNEHQVGSSGHYPGADGKVVYGERFGSGYRHHVRTGAPEPLFPFGHGLSYSKFSLGEPTVHMMEPLGETAYEVSVPVSHISGPAGRQVVQLYLAPGRSDGPSPRAEQNMRTEEAAPC